MSTIKARRRFVVSSLMAFFFFSRESNLQHLSVLELADTTALTPHKLGKMSTVHRLSVSVIYTSRALRLCHPGEILHAVS